MNCMKCGVEIPETQVFCSDCLQVMDAYPIKPGTAVHIPVREPYRRSASRKKPPTPAEQIARLKKTRRRLLILILVLMISLGISLFAVHRMYRQLQEKETIGKNFSTVSTVSTVSTTADGH